MLVQKTGDYDQILSLASLRCADENEMLRRYQGLTFDLRSKARALVAMNEYAANPAFHFWIAKEDTVVGYAMAKIKEDLLLCETVYVAPAHRNQKIGRQLVQAQLDFCKEQGLGFRSIVLKENLESIAMCKAAGLVVKTSIRDILIVSNN